MKNMINKVSEYTLLIARSYIISKFVWRFFSPLGCRCLRGHTLLCVSQRVKWAVVVHFISLVGNSVFGRWKIRTFTFFLRSKWKPFKVQKKNLARFACDFNIFSIFLNNFSNWVQKISCQFNRNFYFWGAKISKKSVHTDEYIQWANHNVGEDSRIQDLKMNSFHS